MLKNEKHYIIILNFLQKKCKIQGFMGNRVFLKCRKSYYSANRSYIPSEVIYRPKLYTVRSYIPFAVNPLYVLRLTFIYVIGKITQFQQPIFIKKFIPKPEKVLGCFFEAYFQLICLKAQY